MTNKILYLFVNIIYPAISLILAIIFKNLYFLVLGVIGFELMNRYFLNDYG